MDLPGVRPVTKHENIVGARFEATARRPERWGAHVGPDSEPYTVQETPGLA